MRWFVILLTFLCLACNPAAEFSAAEDGVREFHARYDGGRFDEIWQGSAPAMKRASGRDELAWFFADMKEQLGETVGTERTSVQVSTTDGVTTTVMVQATRFERGTGTETFTFESNEPDPLLVAYHIDSTDFVHRPRADTTSDEGTDQAVVPISNR